eukprot:COSAG01_NODE_2582_length_7421_cov_4.252253_1_plen_54_part_00
MDSLLSQLHSLEEHCRSSTTLHWQLGRSSTDTVTNMQSQHTFVREYTMFCEKR